MDGYIGQSDIVGPGSLLRARIEAGEGVGSCILWGPPGSGKTYVCYVIPSSSSFNLFPGSSSLFLTLFTLFRPSCSPHYPFTSSLHYALCLDSHDRGIIRKSTEGVEHWQG